MSGNKIIRAGLLILTAGLALLPLKSLNAQTNEGAKVYTVAIDREYIPYEFVDTAGRVSGFTPELLSEIAISSGITFRFAPMAWPDAVRGLENGSVDLINMIRIPQRIAKYEFSEPHSQIRQAIFTHTNASDIIDLESLAGHTVGLQQNDISLEMLRERTDFNKQIVHSKEEGFLNLNIGKLDAFFSAEHAGIYFIREYGLDNVRPALLGIFPQDFCFAARKGNKELIVLLNKHVRQLRESGRYDAITDKWLSVPSRHDLWLMKNREKIVYALIILATFLLGSFLIILILRSVVRKRTSALKESEEKYREVVDGSGDLITSVNPDGRFIYINPVSQKFFGLSAQECLGRSAFDFLHPDDLEMTRAWFDQCVVSKKRQSVIENRQVNKGGGATFYMLWTSNFYYDEKGDLTHINSIARDITERKKAEEKLRQKTEDLEQILYASSHDLRTPLVNVTGYSDELEHSVNELYGLIQHDNLPPEFRKNASRILDADIPNSIRYIKSSTAKMTKLLRALLSLSRLEQAALTLEKLDMNELVADVSGNFKYLLDKQGVQLHLSELPSCAGDREQISQVVLNLLDNALKYLSPQRKGIISIKGELHNDRAVYFIEDNGIGINPEYQAKIFEIFHQLDPSIEGIGLGLTTVKKIVEKHHGKIWVESKPNAGSTFYFSLPSVNA